MSVWRLMAKEVLHRKLSFLLGLVSIAAALACLVGALRLLEAHDIRTGQIIAQKEKDTKSEMDGLEDDIRKAMLKLGFNILIIPKDLNLADFYANDYADKYMPESYVEKVSQAKVVSIRHLLPSLRQKIMWPERKRKVILIGTRGEVPFMHKAPKKPLPVSRTTPVARDTMVVGYELHQSMRISEGDKVKLLGREFTVTKCYKERGTEDDITVWINLEQAQEMLDKKGQISAILALECHCAWGDVLAVRKELNQILPDVRIVEKSTKALARAEARYSAKRRAASQVKRAKEHRAQLRRERENLAAILVPLVMVVVALWVAFLMLNNVRERASEIGLLRALGLRANQILVVFLSKAFLMGVLGGVIGYFGGIYVGLVLSNRMEGVSPTEAVETGLFDPWLFVMALVLAPFLAVVASWIPATLAARQDPAIVLRQE